MEEFGQPLFLCICALIIARFVKLTSGGEPHRGLISAVACTMYVICLFVSAHMQAAEISDSKLLLAKVLGPADYHELGALSFGWSIELLFVLFGEVIGVSLWAQPTSVQRELRRNRRAYFSNRPIAYASLFLVAIGLVSTVIFSGDLATRADGGQGLYTVLKSSLVIGLSGIVFYNFFNRRLFFFVVIIGVAILVASAVRSPILSVAIAYFAGKVARGEITTATLARFAAIGFVLAVLAAAMSNYRGQIVDGRTADFAEAFSGAISNPFASIYGGGIDTLDGYRLAQKIQPSEPPDPTNLVVAITTFVPRALWPDKPEDLSLDVTYRYLHWRQGGIFLSIIGYLSIALGGYWLALVALMAITIALSRLYMRNYRGFSGFIILLITFRLFLAGSPFDVYYGLLMLMMWSIARISFEFALRTSRKPQVRAALRD